MMQADFYKTSILPCNGIIRQLCGKFTDNTDDFKDYYQESCLQIYKSRENFKGNSSWSTWVYRITMNVCINLSKEKKAVQQIVLEPDFIHTDESMISKEKNSKEALDSLFTAIRSLSEKDRAFLFLFLEERTYLEIAGIMKTSKSNVGVRINRIKSKLKRHISAMDTSLLFS